MRRSISANPSHNVICQPLMYPLSLHMGVHSKDNHESLGDGAPMGNRGCVAALADTNRIMLTASPP
jgi:hypothetical protein